MSEIIEPPAQTIGYRYYMGIHFAIAHGPVDAVLKIFSGDREAWSGNVTSSSRITIDAEQLFGGDKREGGIKGDVDLEFGEDTQAANDYLLSRLGAPQPGYRGVLGMVLRQCYVVANNPYIKPFSMLVRRAPKGWNEGEALIGDGANPAHIIRECLVDPSWGMGYPDSAIDDASFAAASTTLIAEGFGLSLIWTQQQEIRAFVQQILDHVGGVLVVSPSTGQFQITLIRDDYDPALLPVLDEDLVVELESYQRAGWGETINELTVVYTHPDNYREAQVTAQDLANVQLQGPVAETRQYPGITDDALAARVAMRDLTAVSRPLAKITMRVNREVWALTPGDAFKFSWAPLGIVDLVCRVVTIDTGTLQDQAIRVQAVEDTFAFRDNAYTEPQPPGWTDPTDPPTDTDPRLIVEAGYWELTRRLPQDAIDALDAFDGFIGARGGRPSGSALNYRLHSTSSGGATWGDETAKGYGDFSPHAVLAADLGQEWSSTIAISGAVDLDLVRVGQYGYIEAAGLEHEAVEITAIDSGAGTITINRGILDTVPQVHPAGARIWLDDRYVTADPTTYIYTEQVVTRLPSRTPLGEQDVAVAPQDSFTVQFRKQAPYPPGRVLIDGAPYPGEFEATLSVSWAHRDRLSQTGDYPRQTDASIGPEAGTTYTLRIYGETGALQRTYSGLTGTSQDYTVADDIADNGLGRESRELTIEIESLRDGFVSWQAHRITSVRSDVSGWGLHWGYNYGGPGP